MTEAEWLASDDPRPMLEFLKGKASERKLRLFACACCHQISQLFSHDDCARCVDVAERFADGLATMAELREANELGLWAGDDASWKSMRDAAAAWATGEAAHAEAYGAAGGVIYEIWRMDAEDELKLQKEALAHCALLRDIFGDSLAPVALAPDQLTAGVRSLAECIYSGRAFERLPILADALEEAGCTSTDILAHCRGPGPHARGCWVVDLILSKDR